MDTVQTRLSDNQRRFVCRIVFLLVCFFPTLACLYCITHQPSAADWQQLIQSRLPIKVKINSVETPLPNQLILRGLEILPSDKSLYPELDGFTASEVTVKFGFAENEISFIEPIEVETHALAGMLQRIMSQLDHSTLSDERWQVSFNKVLLTDSKYGTRDFLLKPMSLTVQRKPSTNRPGQSVVEARVLARPQDDNPDAQICLQFEQIAELQYISVDTQSGFVPANLLKHLVDGAPEMGASSIFRGSVEIAVDAEQKVDGLIRGDILNLRLDGLPDHEKRLTGYCDVRDLICRVEGGRIESGQMAIRSLDAISVDRSLFDEAHEFGIEVSVQANARRVSLAKLDMRIALQGGNVFFSGQKARIERGEQSEQADCIAYDSGGKPLVLCNSKLSLRKSVPLVSLAKILTGQTVGNDALEFLDQFKLQDRTATLPSDYDTQRH